MINAILQTLIYQSVGYWCDFGFPDPPQVEGSMAKDAWGHHIDDANVGGEDDGLGSGYASLLP